MNEENRLIRNSIRKHYPLILATVVLSLFAAVAEGFSIGLLIPFLQSFSESSSGFSTGVHWVDHYVLGVDASQLERLARICALILVATWLRSVFGYLSSVYAVKSRSHILEDFRMQVVEQLQSVALRFYSKMQGGELINSVTNEIGRLANMVGVVFNVITQGSMFLIYVAVMVLISWELSLVVLLVFGGLSGGLTSVIRSVRQRGEQVTRASGAFTSSITEFINGIRTVTLYNQQPYERKRLHHTIRELTKTVTDTAKRAELVAPISQAIVSTLLILVVFFAVWYLILPGKLDLPFLLAFLFALFRLMPTIHNLNQQRGNWAQNRASLSNIHELLRTDNKPYLTDGPQETPPLRSAIEFDHVTFAYEPGEPVLKDISIRIEKGKTTALVGGSGAGKSTLVDLLPRIYDPNDGHVFYDGTDIRSFTVSSLRDRIAVVSQSTFIFNDTVAANIGYGNPDATPDQIREAARQANALEFIEKMRQGFDTILGERGVRLSGGQRQRIAIARALLRDPEILILDEATSALDTVSERLVQDSLDRLMKERTVIAIAHRLSTIENADWVVVLEDGRVAEQGPYDELLARRGRLHRYHSLQFQTV